MSDVPKEYRALMREAVKEGGSDRPLKRRKRRVARQDEAVDVDGEGEQASAEAAADVDDTAAGVDADGKTPEVDVAFARTVEVDDVDDESDEDFDDDEFEDVDLENVQPKASSMLKDVTIALNKTPAEPEKKSKRRNVIDKHERLLRKTIHRNYLATMMVHGFIRNQWCNDEHIHRHLRKLIPVRMFEELHPSSSIKMPQMRTRQFLDGLRHLLQKWVQFYKVTSNKGLYRHDWYDWDETVTRTPTPFSRFQKCIVKGRGSRDIGAQGFVALLRAADVPSRLVFSLQPPDITNMQIKEHARSKDSRGKRPHSAEERLLLLRKGANPRASDDRASRAEIEMKYPVFWAEAWDSVSKTWYTIDPIMFKTIENIKTKSVLEPPMSYPYNQLNYVIGYDRGGRVRDITKRYAEKYYARTRKKRITKDEAEDIWYSGFIDALSSRPINKADKYEQEYFAKKAEDEGMPDNLQDFKNHPFYVLEKDLRSNEVLHPKESCGMLRIKGKNESIPVYKRACVVTLRSPRAWYQRGRILKPGVPPLKVRQKTSAQMARNLSFGDDDEDKEERLYAEFQTELYVPPPAIDGLIEKNAYGNIDVFVPSMIPKGAILIQTPYALEAAKQLEIDYAPAVVGFKFDRRSATPRIEGVVVGEEFKDILPVIQEQIKAEEIEKERVKLEIRALKAWSLMLSKLRIKRRLEKSHGKVDEDEPLPPLGSDDEFDKLQKEYEDYMDNDESDDSQYKEEAEEFEDGGFLSEDIQRPAEAEEFEDGGFIVDDNGGNKDYENDGLIIDKDNGTGVDTEEYEVDDEEPHGDGFIVDEIDTGAGEDDHETYNPEHELNTDSNTHGAGSQGYEDDMDEYEKFMADLEETVSGDEMKITELVQSDDQDDQGVAGDTGEPSPRKDVTSNMIELESEMGSSPVKDVPVKDVPVKDVPVKDVSVKDVPVKDVSVKDVPVEDHGIYSVLKEERSITPACQHEDQSQESVAMDEFEKRFNEQLEQEQGKGSNKEELDDYYDKPGTDDDFEYDSD
ncbi:RAD4 [Cyberlindnera jadinii]|uniref:RAD4 protein n=1 Tax=Cyberlindnera jadinii (strain ATCC 18201 / CBS 1600 / BCRC 20928 / JCM 3617 / NBRC 0987 / NRRL Y-1542) TaxID=983966 RepID=A0A0H5CBB8_CYBJN|nr:RAD4 [Cyberlindnera jadinii]